MENYFKISFASFMAFAISSLLSYLVLPYNEVLASVIAWGAIIMLVIATFAFAVAIYCFVLQTFTSKPHRRIRWEDEFYDATDFRNVADEMDAEAERVEYICNALEKVASASGDGTFDKQSIMLDAIDFRERAKELRHRVDVLCEARDNRKFDGIKQLLDTYSSEPLFNGLAESIESYLPKSLYKLDYIGVDDRLNDIYGELGILCDKQSHRWRESVA
jgi:hypothetical protein